MFRTIDVASRCRSEFIDITARVEEIVRCAGVTEGLCTVGSTHTTAGITVNEGADPAVQRDMVAFLDRLVPVDPRFTHAEGNSDAHIKTSFVGTSVTLPVTGGRLHLGTWQAIYLCEFDGPRRRNVTVTLLAGS